MRRFSEAAILWGARSLSALAQWGRERSAADPGLLTDLGLPPGRSPSVARRQRRCKALDVEACERAAGGGLARSGVRPADALAVAGKTLGGLQGAAGAGAHLAGAPAQRAGAILAQVRRAGQGHELAAAKRRLGEGPLAGRQVTADALLTQRAVRRAIVGGGGDDPRPAEGSPSARRDGLATAFPPLDRQPPRWPDATVRLRTNRGHWGIETRTRQVRAVTCDEDRGQVRSGAAPQAFVACKHLAIALLRRAARQHLAEALRSYAGRPHPAVALVASAGIT